VTISGHKFEIDGILLHSALAVARWQSLLAQAQALLGTFSSGIGVWGSPGVALAGAAAIGFLEAAVTNANQKQGLHLLGEAMAIYERLKPRGVIMPVSHIIGIDQPVVSRWKSRGAVSSELDVRGKQRWELANLRNDYGATDEELASGFLIRETSQDLIILPDDFVTCRSRDRSILIKWSAVETYEVIHD
jgi:hypothetical protein